MVGLLKMKQQQHDINLRTREQKKKKKKPRDAVPVETHKLALAHHRVSSSSSG